MKEIENRKDIEFLVDEFYRHVVKDEVIGFFFTEVIELDFREHMPIMYDFWESNLLGTMTYKGNPMTKHILLNQKASLTPEHFQRWLQLWEEIIAKHFKGTIAQDALKRAQQIAGLMQFKIQQHSK